MSSVIKVGGFVPFTTIDYPEHLSAVVFCLGCPFNCSYCHNTNLKENTKNTVVSWDDIFWKLKERRTFLEAVVFSGGEPTLTKNIREAIIKVKELGYKIGLHTAGPNPKKLAKILPLIDWVGMDIKAPFTKYSDITKVANSGDAAFISMELILKSGVDYCFRTTVHPKLLNVDDLQQITDCLYKLNAKNYTIQHFRENGCNDTELCNYHQRLFLPKDFIKSLKAKFQQLTIIG